MRIDILTLFPEMFAPLEHSIVGKARDKGLLKSTTTISERRLKRLAMWMMNLTVVVKGCYSELNRFLTPWIALNKPLHVLSY